MFRSTVIAIIAAGALVRADVRPTEATHPTTAYTVQTKDSGRALTLAERARLYDDGAAGNTREPALEGGLVKAAWRDEDGHFYVIAKVNGANIRFLVDTGASIVILRPEDAARAGIRTKASDFTEEAVTAGGSIALAPVTLKQVAIGPLAHQGIEAAIDGGGLDVSLLGQSYLRRLRAMTIEGDRLTMR